MNENKTNINWLVGSQEKLLLNCTINILTIFLYNIDKKQRECGYNKKNKTTH